MQLQSMLEQLLLATVNEANRLNVTLVSLITSTANSIGGKSKNALYTDSNTSNKYNNNLSGGENYGSNYGG